MIVQSAKIMHCFILNAFFLISLVCLRDIYHDRMCMGEGGFRTSGYFLCLNCQGIQNKWTKVKTCNILLCCSQANCTIIERKLYYWLSNLLLIVRCPNDYMATAYNRKLWPFLLTYFWRHVVVVSGRGQRTFLCVQVYILITTTADEPRNIRSGSHRQSEWQSGWDRYCTDLI